MTLVHCTDTKVFLTIAIDLVATQVQEPIRFVKETKARVFPTGEKFWIPSKPKIHEVYIMKLKEVTPHLLVTMDKRKLQ